MATNVISQIKKVAEADFLRIDIYEDELVFMLWESEVPIAVKRDKSNCNLDFEYLKDSEYMMDAETLESVMTTMKVIDENIAEILGWMD